MEKDLKKLLYYNKLIKYKIKGYTLQVELCGINFIVVEYQYKMERLYLAERVPQQMMIRVGGASRCAEV